MRRALIFALFLADAAASQEPRVGSFSTSFTERSPLSSMKEFTGRCKWTVEQIKKVDPAGGEYDLPKESFRVHVPQGSKPGAPHGLLVYISAGNDGSPSPDWIPILEKHDLIWIGANQSGNERLVWYRTNLALDAVHNLKKLYTIDEERIYVSGESGGGRSASRTALGYPDVFSGGVFMIGCDYFRNVKSLEAGKSSFFPAQFPEPAKALLTRAKTQNRFVILTGEKDMNRNACLSAVAAFKEDKFVHVSVLDLPGMGHQRPTGPYADGFEKAIAALDAPLVEQAKALLEKSLKLEAQGKPGEALLGYRKAVQRGAGEKAAEAAAALEKKRDESIAAARRDLDDKKIDSAVAALTEIVKQYGELQSGEAGPLLQKLTEKK
jgi:hypothetical protein